MLQRAHELPQQKGQMFVTDGGVETHLIFNLDQQVPDMSVYLLNGTDAGREVMRDYYRAYIPICRKAGQGFLFDTNTWRANPDWAFKAGLDMQGAARGQHRRRLVLQGHAARVRGRGRRSRSPPASSARAATPGSTIAGMTVEESISYHGHQIEAFADSEADYVSAYTLTNVPEAVGIARLAKRTGLPVVLSFTLETDGNLPGGKSLEVAINEVDAATGDYPAYYMINCVHPIHFAETVRHAGRWVNRIGGLRVNASKMSHAELDNSPTLDIGDITDLAQRYARLMPLLPNIRVIGGCCGTDHRHIGAICDTCLPGSHHHLHP
ncbi:homocysteine S-methyltransferase family protein [Devosia ginsengisoli]|uniref:homocysteine S-methyltransferase family protein n=1 Tax=Devosia ginsengisoli TaxID=400770 RepID=UPI0026EE0647|nr:homocysteine S-methyltransferase family protein [Devosia ginsengisoli]MCR6671521.1 homocysteine S-methyltransferase family protein [Devosia ginsengisoli]